MACRNFLVGQKVQIRDLHDLRNEFGYDIDSIENGWNREMNELCGKTIIIEKIWNRDIQHLYTESGQVWLISFDMIKPVY